MNIFFTSDTHFGHFNIIKYCNRPFKTLEEMNETLIQNWNNVVKPKDTIYHLGDFSFGNSIFFTKRLNGIKILVEGNHDFNANAHYEWDTVYTYRVLRFNKIFPLVLMHYPLLEWDGAYRGAIHLHGHIHSKNTEKPLVRRLDVGVDGHNYTPWSLDEILSLMKDIPSFGSNI